MTMICCVELKLLAMLTGVAAGEGGCAAVGQRHVHLVGSGPAGRPQRSSSRRWRDREVAGEDMRRRLGGGTAADHAQPPGVCPVGRVPADDVDVMELARFVRGRCWRGPAPRWPTASCCGSRRYRRSGRWSPARCHCPQEDLGRARRRRCCWWPVSWPPALTMMLLDRRRRQRRSCLCR